MNNKVRIVTYVDAVLDRQILTDDPFAVITYGNASLAVGINHIINDMTG